MNNEEIKESIVQCLENIGICIEIYDDVNLQDYVTDSLTFLMFIVEIEDTFNIEMPADVAAYDEICSLANFVNFLKKILEVQNEKNIKEN